MSEGDGKSEVVQWLTFGDAWPVWGREVDAEQRIENRASEVVRVGHGLVNPRGGILMEITSSLGGGKTTLAMRLAEYLDAIALLEGIEGNDALPEYGERMGDWFWYQQHGVPYPEKDMVKLAMAQIGSQEWFGRQSEGVYVQAPKLVKESPSKVILIEPSQEQNEEGYCEGQMELLELSPENEAFINYKRECGRRNEEVVETWAGQRLLVHIDLEVDEVLKRIGARMEEEEERGFEGGTPKKYVKILDRRLRDQARLRALGGEPVLVVDGNIDFRNGGEVVERVANAVEALRG
jgi:deoxyadenosine/deoxycytidine kinase